MYLVVLGVSVNWVAVGISVDWVVHGVKWTVWIKQGKSLDYVVWRTNCKLFVCGFMVWGVSVDWLVDCVV